MPDIDWWVCINQGTHPCALLMGLKRVWAKLQDLQALTIAFGATAESCTGLNLGAPGMGGESLLPYAGPDAPTDMSVMDTLGKISDSDAGNPDVRKSMGGP